MDKQKIYKANCNGNTFTIIFHDELIMHIDESSIQYLCSSSRSNKDDGLLVINRLDTEYDFIMDYYNNDGTWETMCANGALCVINLLLTFNHQFNKMKFKAGDGIHNIKFKNGNIFLGMRKPIFKTNEIEIGTISGAHIDSGAKHFVVKSNIINNDTLYELAQEIRFHDNFHPDGVNVNFLLVNSVNEISVITYEKGIEKIMLSCGSGSVAAAFYAFHIDAIKSPLKIVNQGGDMSLTFDHKWENVWLSSNPILETKLKINCF